MRIAFLLVTILCAIALSLLSYIMATGHIPFRPETTLPPPPVTEGGQKHLSVPPDEKAMIDDLIKSLKTERETYEKKRTELEADRAKENLESKITMLSNLKGELQKLQAGLDNDIKGLEETEKKNFQTLADVYSKMEPVNAAGILKKSDKRRAAIILSLMNERQAAAILDEVTLMGEDSKSLAVEWADVIRKIKNEATKKGAGAS